jgi:hypothetical protein
MGLHGLLRAWFYLLLLKLCLLLASCTYLHETCVVLVTSPAGGFIY